MKVFRSTARWLLAVLIGIASGSSASAQLVEYNFTGTYQSGDQAVGNEVTGSVVLDLGTPGLPGPGAPFETIFYGGTAVNVSLSSGLSAGTATGGETSFSVAHVTDASNQLRRVRGINWDATTFATTSSSVSRIIFVGASPVNTQIDVVPDPWDVLSEEVSAITVNVDVPNTDNDLSARYQITSFTKKVTNVIIGGIDTGIRDVVYRGMLISAWISKLEATSPNKCVFLARVTVLATQLRCDKVITASQRNRLIAAALVYKIRRT
ncbi:MAG: hypothetical protein ACK58L_21610 [Planctomycetota bacterium]